MKRLGLILFPQFILLYLCFKNLDLSDIQLAHLDLPLITLFIIITFFEPILPVCFFSLNNKFACFILMVILF